MFEKIKKTLSKVVSKESKTKSSNSRASGNYNHRSRNAEGLTILVDRIIIDLLKEL